MPFYSPKQTIEQALESAKSHYRYLDGQLKGHQREAERLQSEIDLLLDTIYEYEELLVDWI